MAEAKRLWEFESAAGGITTISAAMILGTRHMRDGTDQIGAFYLQEAVAMGNEAGLFTTVEDLGSEEGLARAVTAWGVFVCQAIVCQHFMRPMPIPAPPDPRARLRVRDGVRGRDIRPLPPSVVSHADPFRSRVCRLHSLALPHARVPRDDGQGNRDGQKAPLPQGRAGPPREAEGMA